MGAQANDFLLAVDGFVVEDEAQEAAVLGFTDDPVVTLIVDRKPEGLLELRGDYRRWNFGPPGPPAPSP